MELQHRHTVKVKKTQINHTVRLNHVALDGAVFERVSQRLTDEGLPEQPLIANLAAGPGLEGFRIATFDQITNGTRHLCSCQAAAHDMMRSDARSRSPSFVPGSWPHEVLAILDELPYLEGVCHFCVAESKGVEVLSAWFGRQVQTHLGPYIDALARGAGLDKRTAAAEARRRLGLSRWTREAELHRIVLELFPNARVQREASPPWLGQQRLDIFLPELQLALEYQGEQHYHPVGAFGGEEALVRTQARDERKRALCAQNGVTVVDIRYDDPLTVPNLRARLRRWLSTAP